MPEARQTTLVGEEITMEMGNNNNRSNNNRLNVGKKLTKMGIVIMNYQLEVFS